MGRLLPSDGSNLSDGPNKAGDSVRPWASQIAGLQAKSSMHESVSIFERVSRRFLSNTGLGSWQLKHEPQPAESR